MSTFHKRRRLIGGGAAAAALTLVMLPTAAAHAIPGDSGKPAPEQRANANRALNQYGAVAGTSYWTMAAGNNCTNYVAWRLIQDGMPRNITWLHNASEWAREARAHKVPVNQRPAVGAVAQWDAGSPGSGPGHVAYVEAIGNGWILVSEDNYASGPRHLEVFREGTPQWPSHFIHFTTQPKVDSPSTSATAWRHLLKYYESKW